MAIALVNASGAKIGGARTILRQLLRNIPSAGYVVACPNPDELRPLCPSAEFVDVQTNGPASLLFTLFGAAKLARIKGCSTIVSLMNFNVLGTDLRRITYFHQLKAIDGTGPKERLQRRLLKQTNGRDDLIICQTPYVLSRLQSFGFRGALEARWPGFENLVSRDIPKRRLEDKQQLLFLLPSSNLDAYKNVQSVVDRASYFERIGARVIITGVASAREQGPIQFLPLLPRNELYSLYEEADALLFPSLLETVALPIFEFLGTGKPVFILKSPYTNGLFNRFGNIENLHPYEQDLGLVIDNWLAQGRPISAPRDDFAIGDWSWLPR